MRSKERKLMIAALLLGTAAGMSGQTKWKYTYDAAGNRTKREVTSGANARQKATPASTNLFADGPVSAMIDGGHTRLKIETLGKDNADIAIHDLSGKEQLTVRAASEVTTIDLSPLRRGTYVLTVEADGEKRSCKFNK